jgi:formate hydrogenlyase transcriptional activator
MRNLVDRELIGGSPKFRAALDHANLVAPVDCAVLIQGETGTGKELVAQAIHDDSPRSNGPFVKLNCAAIPAGLLESELFGHERGAYTGAVTQRIGRLQLAHRGTLFLDEIGDLPLELQPKLLRALQEREFERLGSSQTVRVDVRIVAATNHNLTQLVSERRFRADLYYRLNVFPIMLPPLRERVEDIPILIRHFLSVYAARMNKVIDQVPEQVMDALRRYSWPGNVRELQNFVERAVVMTEGKVLRPPPAELCGLMQLTSREPARTLAEMERGHIEETLQKTNWVIGGRVGAAAQLGLPRTTLLSRMRKLGISRDTFGVPSAQQAEPAGSAIQHENYRSAFAHAG